MNNALFTNNLNNLTQTPISSAYQFNSFSPYIINNGLTTKFSHTCIFCSSTNSISLVKDNSFKQCKKCNKQFRANHIA